MLPAISVELYGRPSLVKQYAARRTLFTWGRPTEAEQNELVAEMGAYWDYCKSHVARLLKDPGDDFMSDVIRVHQEDPDLIDQNYLYNTMLNFLFAGHETTTAASTDGFRSLLEHHESWEAVCRDPSLVPNAVEEILRYNSSVIATRRKATATTRVGGVEIPDGANVLVMIGSGNHDEAMFAEAGRFDISRDNASRQLAFGFGGHLCLGAPLARLEMRVIIEELARRLPHARLVDGQTWEYSPNTAFRGPSHLLIEWDPTQNPIPTDRPRSAGIPQEK